MSLLSESIGVGCAEPDHNIADTAINDITSGMIARFNNIFGKEDNDYPLPFYTTTGRFALTSESSCPTELIGQFNRHFEKWLAAFEEIADYSERKIPPDGIADTLLMADIADTELFARMQDSVKSLMRAIEMCEYGALGDAFFQGRRKYSEAVANLAFEPLRLFLEQQTINGQSEYSQPDTGKLKILVKIDFSINEIERRIAKLPSGNVFMEYLETDKDAKKTEAAIFGFKYIFSKWIKVLSVVHSEIKAWIDAHVSIAEIATRIPGLLTRSFLLEIPDAKLLNMPVKFLAANYVKALGDFVGIDPRPHIYERVTLVKFKKAFCACLWLTALEKRVEHRFLKELDARASNPGGLNWVVADLLNTCIEEDFPIVARLLLSPDLVNTSIPSRFADYTKSYSVHIPYDFVNGAGFVNSHIPIWIFISVIHNHNGIMQLRRILSDLENNRSADADLLKNIKHSKVLRNLDRIKYSSLSLRSIELSKLQIHVKVNTCALSRKEGAPDILPENILVVTFTESASVRLPIMLAVDEYLIPCALIPTSPKTVNYLLAAYGADKNDPLVYPGPFSETIIDTANPASHKHFIRYCYFNMEMGGIYLSSICPKSATPIDIRPYLTGDPQESSPRQEDIFTKYQLQPRARQGNFLENFLVP